MTSKFNNNLRVTQTNTKKNLDSKQALNAKNSQSPGVCSTDKASKTNAKVRRDESSDLSNQKANSCDKASVSSVSNDSNNIENKRPILRVNLIKKSTRPINILTSSISRRNLEAQQRLASRATISTITNTTSTISPETSTKTPSNTIFSGHDPKDLKKECKKSDTKSSDIRSKINNKEKREPNRSNQSISSNSLTQDEAKKSQKLVVSMIRDISKTVGREDLDELLNEINNVIDEIRQRPQSIADGKLKLTQSDKNKHQKQEQKKPESSRGNKKTSDRKLTRLNSVTSKKDPKPESKDSNNRKTDDIVDSSLDLSDEVQEGVCQSGKSNLPSLVHETDSLSEESANEIQKQYKQFVIDLSSDEDTLKGSNRKTNGSRLPSRCLRVTSSHAKYISPHRKRSLEDRLNRAQEAREKFLEYRANKFREILKKVEEMRAWKEEDTINLRTSVQTKLQKAAAKRKEQLDKIIRKAHDEDSKVSEIQFINNLEAQNRRHDINSRRKEFEARLQDLQDERQRKFEEKQAKEMAAEERRKTLEAERKAKLLEIQQKRRLKDQKVEQQQQVKEKKRIEKNRDRDQKITAIKEAYNAGVQTLKRRINQKQEQSERRHEVNLRLIRQKAFELSIKRYNSFISETRGQNCPDNQSNTNQAFYHRHKGANSNDLSIGHENQSSKRLQLKPFNTKKFCNLCKETIGTELALFAHLRSENHHSSINEHYGDTMLTTNDVVEIHNLRHIVDTDEPLDSDKDAASDDQQSSRASSLVNYYHGSHLSQANSGISMSESDRDSLLAIERKCRKLRHKLIVAGKPFSREWFTNKIRSRLAQLLIQQRIARNQTTITDASSLANTIDLSANNSICQQNKPFYLKINRITRELIIVATDQRISGGGLMPAGITHSVDRLLADINKQLSSRKVPRLSPQLLEINYVASNKTCSSGTGGDTQYAPKELDADQLAMATKMIEFYAIDTLYLYDIVVCLIAILKRIVPNVSLTSKLPSTVASHYSTLIDPVSLNSYYCHRSPVLPTRVYLKMISMLQSLCSRHPDLCYIVFHSNNMIYLSDILSYRLGFIIGNESPASSISGSSSAATLSAHTIDRSKSKQNQTFSVSSSKSNRRSSIGSDDDGHDISVRSGSKSGQLSFQSGVTEDDEDFEMVWDRAETYKRTEDIVDDMTAGLCKLLATVTDTILTWPLVLLNNLDKVAFDQRSNDFISYMVSVGIVDTESVIMSHIHQQQHLDSAVATINNSGGQSLLSLSSSSAAAATVTAPGQQAGDRASSGNTIMNSNSTDQQMIATAQPVGAQQTIGGVTIVSSSNLVTAAQQQRQLSSAASSRIINFTTSCVQFVTSLVKLVIAKTQNQCQNLLLNGCKLKRNTKTISCLEQQIELVIKERARDHFLCQFRNHQRLPENGADSSTGANSNTGVADQIAQQDATQLLATLKLTQLSGVLTLVYDLLVQSFNSLAPTSDLAKIAPAPSKQQQQQQQQQQQRHQTELFVVGTVAQLSLALVSLRLINYVAYIDVRLVQATLGADEMLPLQLRHVCSYLINFLVQSQFRPSEPSGISAPAPASELSGNDSDDHERNSTTIAGDQLKSELIAEIILLLGHFAYLNHDNQLMLKSGRQPTIIEQLVNLPFDYFSRARLKSVLMPTLISCAFSSDQICALVCQDLNLSMLTSFIEDQLLGAQVERQQHHQQRISSSNHSLVTDELTNSKLSSSRWQFERRFAKSKWLSAKKFFESQQAKARLSCSK